MKAINLKTEYLKNPVGVDFERPTLMWNCDGGIKQTAYRITAKSSLGADYDSGKITSDDMRAEYPLELSSRERVEWSVTLWDESGVAGETSSAFFETGLINPDDFGAEWITGNYKVSPKRRYPVDCFMKQFNAKNVVKARLYATACGLYEVKINGARVGDFVLAPGVTDYRRRVQYQTYDVTALVKDGKNVITSELADGWYRGSCGAWGIRNQYGKETKFLCRLEMTYSDKSSSSVVTDDTWNWSNDGAIRFADNKDGEIVDARMEPSYSEKAKITSHRVIPSASNNVNLSEHETFAPVMIKTPSGKTVLDFGQNIAGYVSFGLDAKDGQKIVLRFGEMLDENGEFTQKNIQCSSKNKTTPLQKIEYTCRDGLNEYKTKFAIFGFRYALVETDVEFEPKDFFAVAVYSDMEQTLSFDSSNELLNKFVEASRWSAKNNHADLPTDCPTRERHGWTGDAQIFCKTAGYFFDYAALARKYERMLVDEQRKNGKFTQIVPGGGVDFYMRVMDGSAGWSDAGVLIPYRMWKLYGDEKIIRENYAAMKKYAEFKIKTLGKWYPTALPTGIGIKNAKNISNYGQSYGEWAEPVDVKAFAVSDFVSPHPEETTAYIVYVLKCMSEIASALGENGNADRFARFAERAKDGYRKLVRLKKFSLDTSRQAKLVRPLYLDLLDDEQSAYAKERLIKALDEYGWRLGTGFLSTPFILYVLQSINVEYAYRLLENEEMPGWLFMPKNGADTIWESWEGTKEQSGVASLDHYSKGAVCEWIFSEMCGIKVTGKNSFEISPKVGGKFTFAECEYAGVYGRVKSGWRRSKDTTVYSVTIPPNTSAKIILPNGERNVGAGEYEFTVPSNNQ